MLRQEPRNGFTADVWSMGIVLYDMLTSRRPFSEHEVLMIARDCVALSDPLKFTMNASNSKYLNILYV